MSKLQVDLNCDLGESFGAYQIGNDEAIMKYITSANIACGFHAGDPLVMQQTVTTCLKNKVAIGAHPGLPDLVGFGRRAMAVSPAEVYAMVTYQIGALQAFVIAEGSTLHHVKPHGALYNMAATDEQIAMAIAKAVSNICPQAVLYGLSGSKLINAGSKVGLKTASEVFADRTYQADGTLTPRNLPNALITDKAKAAEQVIQMVKEGTVAAEDGTTIEIVADTICIHGDGPHALAFASYISEALTKEGINLKAL
jgi:5-oxoprolinase (ATP-hydrolysing) subunit A